MVDRVAVLVVDGQLGCRACGVLREAGYQVKEIRFAPDLIEQLVDFEPRLAIFATERLNRLVRETLTGVIEESLCPVFVIGSDPEEDFVIEALKLGADGCLVEPFGDTELVARVEAHLRRFWDWGLGRRAVRPDLVVDGLSCSVLVQGREVRLTPTEYRLISTLADYSGEVVSSEDLCQHIWGLEDDTSSSTLRLYISHLRKKLENDPRRPRYLKTKWGVGYYLDSDGSES